MPKRVVFFGLAAVFEDDRQITEPSTLRYLDGLVYDDEFFTDYLGRERRVREYTKMWVLGDASRRT